METRTETRFVEFRISDSDSRTLVGTALKYGETAALPWGKERFESGAFGSNVEQSDIVLNFQHDRARPLARTGGGGVTLRNTEKELTLTAKLPNTREADDALELVKAKVLRGFSIEFYPTKDRFEGTISDMKNSTRIVERAKLTGIGLVDKPAYKGSKAAVRERFEKQIPQNAGFEHKAII